MELTKMLKALAERYGIRCDVSFEELLSYLNAPLAMKRMLYL